MIKLIPLFIVLAGHGQAPQPGSQIGIIRSLILAEKWSEALELTRDLERDLVKRAHLEVFHGKVLESPPEGLGMYKEAPGGVVKGKEIFLYAQVRNHGVRQKNKKYEIHLVSDLLVLDAQGAELARDEAFGKSHFFADVAHEQTFVLVAL